MKTNSDLVAIVAWMLDRLEVASCLYQHEVIDHLHRSKLSGWITESSSGGESIAKPILDLFRKQTPHIVWVRGEQMWRRRAKTDGAGRLQS